MIDYSDPEAQFVTIEGKRYAYRRSGKGSGERVTTILLLHGLAETSRFFWREFIPHFENEYTVVAIDLRGHGDSAKPRRGYAPGDQARLVALFIDELGLDKPVLLGHSLGGIIATKFAILFPDRLCRLIIYDSPLGGGFWRNLTLATRVPFKAAVMMGSTLIPLLGRLLFKFRSPKTMRMMLESLQVLCDPSHFTPEMLKETMRNSYEAISQSLWQAVIFANLLKDLNRISVPTLIIRGEHDIVVPQDWAERAVVKIPNAQLVLIKNASHLALVEQPDQFNQAVSQFLKVSE